MKIKFLIILFYFLIFSNRSAICQRNFLIGMTGGVGRLKFIEAFKNEMETYDEHGLTLGKAKQKSIHKGNEILYGLELSFVRNKFSYFVNGQYADLKIQNRSVKNGSTETTLFDGWAIDGYRKGESLNIYTIHLGLSYSLLQKNNLSAGIRIATGYYWGRYETKYAEVFRFFDYPISFSNDKTKGKFDSKFKNRFVLNPGIEAAYKINKFEFAIIPEFEYGYFLNKNDAAMSKEPYTGNFISYNVQAVIKFSIFNLDKN